MFWMKIRGGLVTTISVITCPCFWLPLIHLSIVLLAGTPAAILLTKYIGLGYGVLALVFGLSLSLALRWTNQGPTKYDTQPPKTSKGV